MGSETRKGSAMSVAAWNDVIGAVNGGLDTTDWSAIRNEGQGWFGRFVGALALNVGRAPIVFIDSMVDYPDDRTFVGTAVVFTRGTVVVGSVQGNNSFRDEDVTFDVTAYARRKLKTLSIGTKLSPFRQNTMDDWPGKLTAAIEYEDGLNFSLPFRPLTEAWRRDQFAALLERLQEELAE